MKLKSLNARATKIFLRLIEGLDGPEASRKVDTARGAFMAVHIQNLTRRPETYSVTHYYESNGDLVPDPDVEFLVARANQGGKELVGIYPLAIDHGPLGYVRYAEATATHVQVRRRGQGDLASFCNQWMSNIAVQQDLSKIETLPDPDEG